MANKSSMKPLERCKPDEHDFYQISTHGLTQHTLAQLGQVSEKPPEFICRRCGSLLKLQPLPTLFWVRQG